MKGKFKIMKKIFLFIPLIFFICGCTKANDPLTCTKTEAQENIDTEFTIITEFENKKATNTKATATMYFEDNDSALDYYNAYTSDKTNLEVIDNKIVISLDDDLEDEENLSKNDVKEYFESAGYTCK
jgi:hypothetical protein